jgi:hypothetical protein
VLFRNPGVTFVRLAVGERVDEDCLCEFAGTSVLREICLRPFAIPGELVAHELLFGLLRWGRRAEAAPSVLTLHFHHDRDDDRTAARLVVDRFGETFADVLLDGRDVADSLEGTAVQDVADAPLEIRDHVLRLG